MNPLNEAQEIEKHKKAVKERVVILDKLVKNLDKSVKKTTEFAENIQSQLSDIKRNLDLAQEQDVDPMVEMVQEFVRKFKNPRGPNARKNANALSRAITAITEIYEDFAMAEKIQPKIEKYFEDLDDLLQESKEVFDKVEDKLEALLNTKG